MTSVRYAPSRPLFAGFRHFSLPPPPFLFFLRVAARKRIDSLKIHSPADIVPQFVLREIVERGEQYSAIRSPITINWSLSPSSSSNDNSNPSKNAVFRCFAELDDGSEREASDKTMVRFYIQAETSESYLRDDVVLYFFY